MESNSSESRWPACSMLSWGTLGAGDAAGRRYHTRAGAALACMVLGFTGAALIHLRPLTAIVPGAAFFYIAYEFRKYLVSQDELAQRILLESIAWTYLVGGAAAMLLMGIVVAYELQFNPLFLLSGIVCLEPLRAFFLYRVARRYQ